MVIYRSSLNVYYVVFFFSSRRRHTRSYGDWSSDVCSSDLMPKPAMVALSWAIKLALRNLAEIFGIRSEERRVGKECRSRWLRCKEKKKKVFTSEEADVVAT